MSAANTVARIAIIEAAERVAFERGRAEGKREAATELAAFVTGSMRGLHPSVVVASLAAFVTRWRGGEPAATIEARIRRRMPMTAQLAGLAETTPTERATAEEEGEP